MGCLDAEMLNDPDEDGGIEGVGVADQLVGKHAPDFAKDISHRMLPVLKPNKVGQVVEKVGNG